MTKIGGIVYNSIVDGPGMRTAIFFSGCRKDCPGCHNPEVKDFDYGEEMSEKDIYKTLQKAKEAGDEGITLTGGHPLEPENYIMATRLTEEAKKQGFNVWLYTGDVFEYIPIMYMDLISLVDVVVDGPFIEALKSSDALFAGSTNQRRINVQKTFENGKVIHWEP